MTKRTDGKFERRKNDTYDTPFSAVKPLVPHLPRACYFIEPCAGKGDLVSHLKQFGHTCAAAFDIEPRAPDIERRSAFSVRIRNRPANLFFITNPPWKREILHPLIKHLAAQLPTWLLFDADWYHTQQAIPLLPICHKMVSVGRVRWIDASAHDGMDNHSWYLFDASYQSNFIEAYGRQP